MFHLRRRCETSPTISRAGRTIRGPLFIDK